METETYDGRRRSRIVLSSDFECCQKYRHALPEHVELVGGSDSFDNLRQASLKSKHTPSEETLRTQSITSAKSEVGSEKSKEILDTDASADEFVEEAYSDVEIEVVEEEEEYESSICSEWIVLKPEKKRRKKKEVAKESSASDLNEPAGTRRLLKRPPSPGSEMIDDESRPKNLIPSNFFKYTSLKEWPEPPPLDQALLKREPSPNVSLPRSREDLELAGEDWLWFEGRYVESGDLEIHGEGELYYRLPKQWKEGHWEPAPALLERWEREEMELERERQRVLEERKKYEEVLKREDSPGMDVINWGDGPVKLTAWMQYVAPKSLKELSDLLPANVSEHLLKIASEVSPEVLKELMARIDEAMMADNSVVMIEQLLEAYIATGLDALEGKELDKTAVVTQDSLMLESDKTAMSLREELRTATTSSKSVRFHDATQEDLPDEVMEEYEFIAEEEVLEEEVEDEQVPIMPKPEREDPCDPLPESFRETLLQFIQDFAADKPGDPLTYAIGYFQSRIPKGEDDIAKSHPGEMDSQDSGRREAAFRATSNPDKSENSNDDSIDGEDIEEFPKNQKEIDTLVRALHSCWVTRDLDLATVIALVKAMNEIVVDADEEIQSAEKVPDTFYVVKKGAFKIHNKFGTKIIRDKGYFGELSLNAMVAESLKAPFSAVSLRRGTLWCLKRSDFVRIKDSLQKNKNTILFSMLGVMDMFDNLTEEEKRTVIDCLDMKYFKKKDIVFCQESDPEGIYFFLDGAFKLIKIEDERKSSARSPSRTSGEDSLKQRRSYTAKTYLSPRLLGYGNFIERRPWAYSCVAKSNIVQVAILKTDAFERLLGDPEDVRNRPPPPPPRPRLVKRKMVGEVDEYGEFYGEYYGEYRGEDMGEEAPPPPPPPPRVIPWLKKKVVEDPNEPPKPKPPPTYEEIMDAMWGTKPVYQHPKEPLCMCGRCKDAVTCVGQGMKCCDKPKIQIEPKK